MPKDAFTDTIVTEVIKHLPLLTLERTQQLVVVETVIKVSLISGLMKRMTTHLTTMIARMCAATTHTEVHVCQYVCTGIVIYKYKCFSVTEQLQLYSARYRLCGQQVTMLDVELIDVPAFKEHSITLCTQYATMGQGEPYALAAAYQIFSAIVIKLTFDTYFSEVTSMEGDHIHVELHAPNVLELVLKTNAVSKIQISSQQLTPQVRYPPT